MRLATWNLERAAAGRRCSREQLTVMAGIEADLWFLTEAPHALRVPDAPSQVGSGPEPGIPGDVWASIHGPASLTPIRDVGTHPMAVAATVTINGCALVVYGSVLPWLGAGAHLPADVTDGTTGAKLFCHVLERQVSDLGVLRTRYPDHRMVWAGDFNQSLSGPNRGGSKEGRDALLCAFQELHLDAWTAGEDHAEPGLSSIDHVTGSSSLALEATIRWSGRTPYRHLSDHAGYAVDLREVGDQGSSQLS